MTENEPIVEQDYPRLTPRLPQPSVPMVLFTQLGLFLLGGGLSVIVYYLLGTLLGWNLNLLLQADSPLDERIQVRIQLALGHFFGFLVSGGLTVWFFYRGITQQQTSWPDYLKSRYWPKPSILLMGVLLMLSAIPLVLFSMNINQLIPLPASFQTAESQSAEILKGLLQMESGWEFLSNLMLIAVLPALGEELIFRGVVQQQIMRIVASPIVAIIVSAMIFSAAHFQFEGFLPRMLLGFLLGWLYWQTGNFWVPVVGHFFNNGLQVLGQYLYRNDVTAIDLEKDIQVPWIFAAISLFMVWAVMRLIQQMKPKLPDNSSV